MSSIKNLVMAIKQRPIGILGGAACITFLVVKVVDFFWNMNLESAMGDSVVTYVASISGYSPIIFTVVTVLLAKLSSGKKEKGEKTEYRENYTWKDIFRDRSLFSLVLIMAFFLFGVLQILAAILASNFDVHVITSFADILFLLVVAMVLGLQMALWIYNVILPWFMKTEKGNKVASVIVFVLGMISTCVMSGIDALWSSTDESLEDFMLEYGLSEVIPFDILTLFFSLLTVYLWNKVRRTPWRVERFIKIGFWLAIVSFIISLTPLATVIQFVWIYIRMLFETLGQFI